MKSKSVITIRLDEKLQRQLERFCKQSGRNRSEVIRDSLRRQLALEQFEGLRRQIMPFAEARGFLTDQDIFDKLS